MIGRLPHRIYKIQFDKTPFKDPILVFIRDANAGALIKPILCLVLRIVANYEKQYFDFIRISSRNKIIIDKSDQPELHEFFCFIAEFLWRHFNSTISLTQRHVGMCMQK